jgi:predicted MFS family arabinose efflux permease
VAGRRLRTRGRAAAGGEGLWRAFSLVNVGQQVGGALGLLSASFRQAVVPSRLQGRVNSVYRGASWGVIPIGAALGGVAADHLGLRAPFLLAAAILAVAGAVGLPYLRATRLAGARAGAAEV